MSQASDQITEYLSVGGLFNPEIMNQTQHEAVRDTLIKARDDIQQLERENAALRLGLEGAQMSLDNWIAASASHAVRLGELERENAALREDKARLDYIDSLSPGDGWSIYRTSATKNAELVAGDPRTIRKLAGIRFAIDAARKEAQP